MARSINNIQQEMLDRKEASAELSALEVLTTNEKTSLEQLDATSRLSIWRLIFYVVAVAIHVLERLMDIFRIEIDAKVKANRPHTLQWYKSKSLAFQYGDSLVDSDEYAVIDAEKQIVKQVAVIEGDRKLTIKVATQQGEELVKLPDINMVNAFIAYMNKVKDAGTLIDVVNEDADLLRVELDYYYDPLVVNDAGLVISTGLNVVQNAIESYLKSIEFDGRFEINKMVDYLQRAEGYKDVRINFVGFKAGISTSFSSITRMYEPLSGYMKLEELQVNYYGVV